MYPQGSGFCGSSFGVVGCLDLFTGGKLWDVIHFNWGWAFARVRWHMHTFDRSAVAFAPRAAQRTARGASYTTSRVTY